MTIATAPTSPSPTTPTAAEEQSIEARIQEYVSRGLYPLLAAERVVRELVSERGVDSFINELLPLLLFESWQARHGRPSRIERELARPTTTPGTRRVDYDVLKRADSLLESLFEVGGRWVRLGDLTRDLCRRAAVEQKRAALKRAQYARFFHAVAEALPSDGVAVRSALDEGELGRLFDEAGR